VSEPTVVPISEAPQRIAAMVEAASERDEPWFIATHSGVRAALLGIDAYTALVERLEDLEDSLSILEARLANEPTRTLNDFLRERQITQVADVSG
jgi:PHD/YefM family antitoxin component YafN of YafNO toxin-antitoxin module